MIELQSLNLRYRETEDYVLKNISISINTGETVLICGPSGCGKSTLLNCLNGILFHESNATLSGSAIIAGIDIASSSPAEICRIAGTVFQNPSTQLCTPTVETEVAFGLENIALPKEQILQRIETALEMVGLSSLRQQPVDQLSGGQQQRLAIACALALQPKVLLLDEPLSQLDPQGASEVLKVITSLKLTQSLTVIIVEHRTDDILPFTDQVVLMDRGAILFNGNVDAFLKNLKPMRKTGINLPQLPELFEQLNRPERPLKLEQAPVIHTIETSLHKSEAPRPEQPLLKCSNVTFRYKDSSQPVPDSLSVTFKKGEKIALMGSNGAGKSTLLHLLAGILSPESGTIQRFRDKSEIGLVLQTPDLMLTAPSVYEELTFAPYCAGKSKEETARSANTIMQLLDLEDMAETAPFALSRGQRLRTAFGSILTKQPKILLLDEPTTGQDREQAERIMTSLENRFELVVFCTHDVNVAARHADRIILLNQGTIVADGTPRDILFDTSLLAKASVKPSNLLRYSASTGAFALTTQELREALHAVL